MTARFSFQQQVLAGFVLSLFLVFGVGYNSYKNINTLLNDAKWVDHTREVIEKTTAIYSTVSAVESAQRGFVATGDKRFLNKYVEDLESVIPQINELRELTIDNAKQTARIDELKRLLENKLRFSERSVEIRDKEGFQAAQTHMLGGEGLDYMKKIRTRIDEIVSEEQHLLGVREKLSSESVKSTINTIIFGSLLVLLVVITLFTFIQRTFKRQKEAEESIRESKAALEKVSEENNRKNWILSGSDVINNELRGETTVNEIATKLISALANYTGAKIGAFYLAGPDGSVKLASSFSYDYRRGNKNRIMPGEGLVGQALLEKRTIVFSDIPNDYVHISSGLGEVKPSQILIVPCLNDTEVKAVVELGFTEAIGSRQKEFMELVTQNIGITLNATEAGDRLRELLEKTQQQAEELEAQQEELRVTNEELHKQTGLLQASEEELRVQQEELKQANVELEEKAQQLEDRNKVINDAREAIVLKAEELELTSKYKSEFLANMSHELRTPLNSILILAKMLADNKNGHMTADEIKYASVIHNAGNDLLTLINDILDLSKIEAGKIDLVIERFEVEQVQNDLELLFNELAATKKIDFTIHVGETAPVHLISDRLRLEQIVKNMLSNAFKFTPAAGQVSVDISRADTSIAFRHKKLQSGPVIAISVKDSGIGIPLEKQKLIFEAFQQVDGSTNRKYGGTGLGLSISRELANILGGEIHLVSEPGKGSTFTLYIPIEIEGNADEAVETVTYKEVQPVSRPVTAPLFSDRTGSDDTILVVEDDQLFSDIVKGHAEKAGFKVLAAYDGNTGLEMAQKELPAAIILDLKLPGLDGWTVLKKLKSDPNTAHIPVHIMSAMDGENSKAQKLGAISFLKKPIESEKLDSVFNDLQHLIQQNVKSVLIVEDHELQSDNLKRLLNDRGVDVVQAFTGKEAEACIAKQTFDCLILDLKLPDVDGIELLDKIKSDERYLDIPVVINTAMELSAESMERVMKHSNAMVVKTAKSDERLLDEVNLFFNKIKLDASAPASVKANKKKDRLPELDKSLRGKNLLLVDDDMRNVFALSAALQAFDMNISIAGNGLEALDRLRENESTDIVLMDIMMPEMDGYEAMREIRKNVKWASLPIIALTAKAMKYDREKCIEAGASDYISKPVDIDKLISLIRVWVSA